MTEMFGAQETSTLETETTGLGTPSTTPGTPSTTLGASNNLSTKDTAKEASIGVAQGGVQGGKHVASVAADQAKEVVSEAGSQAQALMAEAKSELLDQASSQKNRVTEQLHALAQELGAMASNSDQNGLASGLAQQASRQVGTIAHWVSEREPGSLVVELKDFARAKPGTFLAIAAGIGLVAGRMTRGVKAGLPQDDHDYDLSSAPPFQPAMTAVVSPEAPPVAPPVTRSLPSAVDSLPEMTPVGPEPGLGYPYSGDERDEPFAAPKPGPAR